MIILSAKRDLPILIFIWKWKIASTSAIAAKYFQKSISSGTAYRRLWQLSRSGYIKSRRNDFDEKHVWQLSSKGFDLIREYLPPLAQDGYKSEYIGHDILVAAAHSGEWLVSEPKDVRPYTEQELRRYNKESLPSWFPHDSDNRPDGYWDFDLGEKRHRVVALEVELTQKSKKDYTTLSDFYSKSSQIDSVLWIVKNESITNAVQSVFQKNDPKRGYIHSFVFGSDLIKQGWNAVIAAGPEKGLSINQFLSKKRFQPSHILPHNKPTSTPQLILASPFLNLQKSHKKTKTSALYKIGDSFD